jgi:hypothetical protein
MRHQLEEPPIMIAAHAFDLIVSEQSATPLAITVEVRNIADTYDPV